MSPYTYNYLSNNLVKKLKRITIVNAVVMRMRSLFISTPMVAFAIALLLLTILGCGNVLEDNGTHLAYALENGAADLRASNAPELAVHFETLDKLNEPYYIEITPSIASGQTSAVWSSYLVVSGKNSGGTSYHNRFLFVPQRLYLKKDDGGSAELVLRKDGDRINLIEVR